MLVMRYYDKDNMVQNCTVYWEGPGNYNERFPTSNESIIEMDSGNTTSRYCASIEEAAGNYAKYGRVINV